MESNSHDLASGSKNIDRAMPLNYKYSLQAVWKAVTGTANGTLKVQQSNDGVHWDQLKTINSSGEQVDFEIAINSANGSATIEDKNGFTGVHIRLALAVGTITGGTLDIHFNNFL